MSSPSTHLPTPEGPGCVPGAGDWLAEQVPEKVLMVLTEFLAPYRENGGGQR